MDDNNDDRETTATTAEPEPVTTARSRGRPRRPTAQKSVHQLVLNLTQSSEKKSLNPNKKQKIISNESQVSATPLTTPLTTTASPKSSATTSVVKETANHWKVGQKVEARDVAGDWYSAKIVAHSDDSAQVLVHFERWSSRYDQWFPRDSNLIRERSASQANSSISEPEFSLHEEVLARWTDNRPYPATVVEVYAQQRAVLVLFFDGYRKKVKFSQIEKMPQNFSGVRVPSLKTGFEIKADHNEFKCHFEDCGKGFRKQSLLAQHLKHYHKSDDKSLLKTTEADVSDQTTPIVTPIVTPKAVIVPKTLEKSVREESESLPVVTSRMKRKYVRKPLPNVAVRKSNRQMISQNDFLPLLTTVTPKEMAVVPTPNTTLPFWDARTVAEIHETDPEELVNCVCDAREESGLMVQCECCLCWQHAHCMHFNGEHDVPKDGYFCLSCRFPKNARQSLRNAFLVNHALKSGKTPQFVNATNQERELLAATNALLASALDTREVLWGMSRDSTSAQERQDAVWRHLSSLEDKVNELEVKCHSEVNSEVNDLELSETQIKSEISLMFSDLKNASILV